jgi:hypothetical protein
MSTAKTTDEKGVLPYPMTNDNQNTSNQEDKCDACIAYANFKQIVQDGVQIEDAFHIIFAELADRIADDVHDMAFSEGYRVGYVESMRTVAEQIDASADKLEDNLNGCDCGCGGVIEGDPIENENLDRVILDGDEFSEWLKERM